MLFGQLHPVKSVLCSCYQHLVYLSQCVVNKDTKGRIRIGSYLLEQRQERKNLNEVYKLEALWSNNCVFFLINHSCTCGDGCRGLLVCPQILVNGGVRRSWGTLSEEADDVSEITSTLL